jgi:hypothetical protein
VTLLIQGLTRQAFFNSDDFVAALLGLTVEFGLESLFAGWASRLDGLPRRAKFLFRMAPYRAGSL